MPSDKVDPARAAIEAMISAAVEQYDFIDVLWSPDELRELFSKCFYAQHGIIRGVPLEATREMFDAINDRFGPRDNFDLMAAAGDLTKAPPHRGS
jgi:hypothetical protein